MQSLAPINEQLEQQEREGVELLAGMMGGDVAADQALRVLRKHKGNVQKAAEAILGGDRGEDPTPSWSHQGSQNTIYAEPTPISAAPQPTQPSSSNVIDLTSDDDDLSRAVQLSLESSQNETTFGPSNRAPDPSWQMVPSNQATVDSRVIQDERTLKDAIQASLEDFKSDELEIFPVEKTVREGGRPIALRPEASGIAYAALVTQALFSVPQVRESVANIRLPTIDINLPRDSPEHAMWNLVELFVNLDLAQLASIVDKEVLPSLAAPLWTGSTESLGDLTTDFVKSVGLLIEAHLNAQKSEDEPDVRLFHFFHGIAEIRGRSPKIEKSTPEGSVVTVEIGDGLVPNDLISRLSANLSRFDDTGSSHDVIFEPSQLVMFQPRWARSATSTISTKSSSDAFAYPKTLYLDQFLVENLRIANEKRALERQMRQEIESLTKERDFITHYDNRDTLSDLRASLYYHENVAQSNGDEDREETIVSAATELKKVLNILTKKVEEIDRKIDALQSDVAVVFDCPELQKHRYDLRAVLVHTGLPGRKQIYSYVQDDNGVWWKTLDYTVTEVPEETVLTDPTGLHLSAGPYLLIYSRHIPGEEGAKPLVWPKVFMDSVEEHNRTFLSLLSQSGAHSVGDDASPYFQPDAFYDAQEGMEITNESGVRYREFNC